jgi:hypothetical protein
MSGQAKGIKRARNENQQDGAGVLFTKTGREQLLLTAPDLQTRLGRKFVDESDLLTLMITHGLVRRVRPIQIEVRPLGGDSFKVTLEASKPTVGEAKAEIVRSQGTAAACQELYRVAERSDGLAVREDDAEPEPLDDESMELGDGDVIAMAVKVSRTGSATSIRCAASNRDRRNDKVTFCFSLVAFKDQPLLWRSFAADRVTLSEGGAMATKTAGGWSLTTTEIELTAGKHYWEVKLLSEDVVNILVGISRPNLNPTGEYWGRECTDSWFTVANDGSLCGNSKYHDDKAGSYQQGDRVGVLLDLGNGSLRFFKNGVQHGPGYAAGSVMGPVVAAVQMYYKDSSVRLLPNAEAPAGV